MKKIALTFLLATSIIQPNPTKDPKPPVILHGIMGTSISPKPLMTLAFTSTFISTLIGALLIKTGITQLGIFLETIIFKKKKISLTKKDILKELPLIQASLLCAGLIIIITSFQFSCFLIRFC